MDRFLGTAATLRVPRRVAEPEAVAPKRTPPEGPKPDLGRLTDDELAWVEATLRKALRTDADTQGY